MSEESDDFFKDLFLTVFDLKPKYHSNNSTFDFLHGYNIEQNLSHNEINTKTINLLDNLDNFQHPTTDVPSCHVERINDSYKCPFPKLNQTQHITEEDISDNGSGRPPKSAPAYLNKHFTQEFHPPIMNGQKLSVNLKTHSLFPSRTSHERCSSSGMMQYFPNDFQPIRRKTGTSGQNKSFSSKVVKQRRSNSNTSVRFVKSSRGKLKSSSNTPKKRTICYEGIHIPFDFQECPNLHNISRNPVPENFLTIYQQKLIKLLPEHEDRICTITRNRYIRNEIGLIRNLYEDVEYFANEEFDIKSPYEPQYFRYFLDLTQKLPFGETRAGLCPYCPELKFYELKTSAYAQHLILQHGIYPNNFLVPNPFSYGLYRIRKLANSNRKTTARELQRFAVVCPCCYEVIQVIHSDSSTKKPLGHYLRHFKEFHYKYNTDPYVFYNRFKC